MKESIEHSLRQAFETLRRDGAWPDADTPDFSVVRPQEEKFGDYTTSVALVLASRMRKSPMAVAQDVAGIFSCEGVAKIDVVAPGHLNFFVSAEVLRKACTDILDEGRDYGNCVIGEGKKALVEFISSNPTGPIHLGNARGGPAGDAVANILQKAGYAVTREFYVNDFGNQILILGHSVLGDSETQYNGEYISELAKARPTDITDAFEVGRWAAREILDGFIRPTCEKVGIRFDNFFSEQSLHENGLVKAMLDRLAASGLTYEEGGALWFRSKDFGDDKDRVLVKSDGKSTYTLADFAYHKDKIDRGFEKMVTFLGADHHSEAKVMGRFVSEVLGRSGALDIVITQMVRIIKDGSEIKMSKRKGVYYALDDLLEEVGSDAVRFIFTSYASTSHINFDINLALERSDKNPVYYVQYAHARLASILKKARESDLGSSVNRLDMLAHEKELSLLRTLGVFPDVVRHVATTYETHRLPRYATTLADKFHSFYGACRVVDCGDAELAGARLALCSATKNVLAETLRLIGVNAPEKM